MSRFNVSVPLPLDYAYTSVEVVCAVAAILGNILVILVFVKYRILRTVTNYYVMSLAVADLLVGVVGIPSAIATSIGLPTHFQVSVGLIIFSNETSSTTFQMYSCFIRRFTSNWSFITTVSSEDASVTDLLKDQLLMNLWMKQLCNGNVVELVSLLNVIRSYSWALSANASCNHLCSRTYIYILWNMHCHKMYYCHC